jgi:hypothetical protein
MDDFTRRHLDAYIATIWEDEREAFERYAIESLELDPTLVDLGWPSLYRAFLKTEACKAS